MATISYEDATPSLAQAIKRKEFSQAEFDSLNAQVGETRLSREQFCRNAICGVAIRENPPTDLPKQYWTAILLS